MEFTPAGCSSGAQTPKLVLDLTLQLCSGGRRSSGSWCRQGGRQHPARLRTPLLLWVQGGPGERDRVAESPKLAQGREVAPARGPAARRAAPHPTVGASAVLHLPLRFAAWRGSARSRPWH